MAKRIASFEELLSIYKENEHLLDNRLKTEDKNQKRQVMVCGGTGCHASESKVLLERLQQLVKDKGLEDKVAVAQTGCFGFCAKGPIVKVFPDDVFYVEVKRRKCRQPA